MATARVAPKCEMISTFEVGFPTFEVGISAFGVGICTFLVGFCCGKGRPRGSPLRISSFLAGISTFGVGNPAFGVGISVRRGRGGLVFCRGSVFLVPHIRLWLRVCPGRRLLLRSCRIRGRLGRLRCRRSFGCRLCFLGVGGRGCGVSISRGRLRSLCRIRSFPSSLGLGLGFRGRIRGIFLRN
jgi:hypothetical protein